MRHDKCGPCQFLIGMTRERFQKIAIGMNSELVIVKTKGNSPPVHLVTPTTQTQHKQQPAWELPQGKETSRKKFPLIKLEKIAGEKFAKSENHELSKGFPKKSKQATIAETQRNIGIFYISFLH